MRGCIKDDTWPCMATNFIFDPCVSTFNQEAMHFRVKFDSRHVSCFRFVNGKTLMVVVNLLVCSHCEPYDTLNFNPFRRFGM